MLLYNLYLENGFDLTEMISKGLVKKWGCTFVLEASAYFDVTKHVIFPLWCFCANIPYYQWL